MRKPLIFYALFLSVLLVGIAGYLRLTNAPQRELSLQVYAGDSISAGQDEISGTSNGEAILPLNEVILGKSLLTEFFSLSQQGKVESKDLDSLADKYAELINRPLPDPQLNINELHTVADSSESLKNYALSVSNIYSKYQKRTQQAVKGKTIETISNPGSSELFLALSNILQDAASDMKKVPVPASVRQLHLELTKIFLSNALAMETLSRSQAEPMATYSALVTQTQNSQWEKTLLYVIQSVMERNGIIFEIDL